MTKKRRTARSGQWRKFWTSFTASAVSAYAMASGAMHLQLPPLSWQGLVTVLSQVLHTGQEPGFSQCPSYFPYKSPPQLANLANGAGSLRELCFNGFAVLHSGTTKTPVFVAERLNKASVKQAKLQTRTDRFYAEARLPQLERANLDDYRGSGYARGHMAPAADMATSQAMAQSFSLANMVPQDQIQNAGAWAKIEADTRQYVLRAKGDVFVFTGPVFATKPRTIGSGRVAVPTHMFKLVFDAQTGRSWVHWQANRADAQVTAPIAYDEFKRRTGMALLPSPRVTDP